MAKLIITEKPSVAKGIADALGARQRREGYIEGDGLLISWCLGHIITLADTEAYDAKYKQWRYQDLPIVPEKWQYTVIKDKRDQFVVLKGLLKDERVDEVVCATDAGREGELIFRWVYKMAGCKKPFRRLWISSMEKEAIVKGMDALRPGEDFDRLYAAAESRARADWLVGINATRLYTTLYHHPLHVGRVQSPTLALIATRDKEIAEFVKQKSFIVHIGKEGLDAKGERLLDPEKAEEIRALCDGKAAAVKAVERTKKTENPPKLYDLTTLQRDANRLHGLTAQQTLDAAQRLYENRCITYPRTDSRYLTGDMQETVEKLLAQMRVEGEIARLIRDDKVGDHHALLPTLSGLRQMSDGPSDEQKVFALIVRQLSLAVGKPHLYEQLVATLLCEGMEFVARGKTILQEGWKGALGREEIEEDAEPVIALPPLKEGQIIEPVEASVTEHFTSPPKPYTEDTLLSAMERAGNDALDSDDVEKKGLGTPATRAGIIERLVQTGSVQRQAKKLLSTDKGRTLASILPDSIKSAYLTAQWENTLTSIAKGEASAKGFMADMEAYTRDMVKQARALDTVEFEDDRESLGACPRCGKKVIETKVSYRCSARNCRFVLYKDNPFFARKKKNFTKTIMKSLLKSGQARVKGLVSERTETKFTATVIMEDNGQYSRFRMEDPVKE